MKKFLPLIFFFSVLTFFLFPTNSFALYQTPAEFTVKVGEPSPSGVHPTPPYTPGDSNHSDCDYRCAIKKEFNITVRGYFTQDTLSWFWTKLWDISQTNFPSLISGTTIDSTGGDKGYSGITPTGIELANYRYEYLVKLIFIHEFGHWIYYHRDGKNFVKEHALLVAQNDPNETPVTKYARPVDAAGHVCSGFSTYWVREDYADMVAYYLNPETTGKVAAVCAGVETNPYLNGGHPGHRRIAEMIFGSFGPF